jgi:hypothetical protein
MSLQSRNFSGELYFEYNIKQGRGESQAEFYPKVGNRRGLKNNLPGNYENSGIGRKSLPKNPSLTLPVNGEGQGRVPFTGTPTKNLPL